MAAITIDTYKMVSILKSKGFSEDQASGITQAVQQIDLDQVSTKQDLRELELRMTIKLGSMLFLAVGFLSAIKFLG